jgi:hypothetical protein
MSFMVITVVGNIAYVVQLIQVKHKIIQTLLP